MEAATAGISEGPGHLTRNPAIWIVPFVIGGLCGLARAI
jgi:hypothetical protein